MAMYSLSVAVADQFLALPMIATAVYWRLWPSWAYVTAGVVAALLVQDEFFRSDRPAFADFTIGGHRILMADFRIPLAHLLAVKSVCSDLLVVVWRNRSAIGGRALVGLGQSDASRSSLAAGCVPALVTSALQGAR